MTESPPADEICRALPWDTEFFGFPIASVTGDRLDRDLAARIDAWCLERQVSCLYFLADSRQPATASCAEANGYRLTDVRITLERPAGSGEPAPASGGTAPSRPGDAGELVAVAGTSHEDSRFYADPNFPRERCAALYETWIRKSLDGWADVVLVARIDDRAAGYITCHLHEAASGTEGKIGLVGVADWARGRGLAAPLVSSALRWFDGREVRRVEVVTQGRNIRAQRLYQKAGFRTSALGLWFHKWYRVPGKLEAS